MQMYYRLNKPNDFDDIPSCGETPRSGNSDDDKSDKSDPYNVKNLSGGSIDSSDEANSGSVSIKMGSLMATSSHQNNQPFSQGSMQSYQSYRKKQSTRQIDINCIN